MTKVFGKYCNAIIVSTNEVAVECIRYLRDNKIGVEMFLPLESLKAKPINEKLRYQQNLFNFQAFNFLIYLYCKYIIL